MSQNLVNLNVNPCKMCMPLGAVTALYGIRGCMSILHGSQGCSTYIRRHMATHYNEPVDIASSSLTEEGTVFGGAGNLIKGLENMIKQYNPEVIGIPTTCLAETIGEDVPRIIKDFCTAHPEARAKLIPIPTPGYGGTQAEGFFRALRAVVDHTEMDGVKNDKINIVTGAISPADTRFLKNLFEQLRIDYILLPDLSENLDGIHSESYQRLGQGGTTLQEIAQMGGARYTLELSTFVSNDASPAVLLNERYGVPYERLNLPVGLRDTDALINKLTQLGGVIPTTLIKERGRYIDAMIDAHKYNGEARPAIYGEADFVYSVVRLASENGIIPAVAATGGVAPGLGERVITELQETSRLMNVSDTVILDDTDFDVIEKHLLERKANLLIGNSDGRRLAEKHQLPLIRGGFPIHDHMGGQRLRMLGYEGSLELMDKITNAMLTKTETTFREELYHRYYQPEPNPAVLPSEAPVTTQSPISQHSLTAHEKSATHPCFNCGASGSARIHLPIAPKCNIQCNYCVRKFDCPNESRPGVTTQILSPVEAFEKFKFVKEKMPNLKVVGIAGPGDALANFDETRETLRLIRDFDPDITFCLSTNGLMLPLYAQELIDLGVSHVTVTMNAVEPAIGAKIYKHVDYMGTTYTGEAAAAILMANQMAGLKYLTERGLVCKVNIVMLRGINEEHIETVVKKVKELGCEITNIMQLIPVKGSAFENIQQVSNKEITALRKKCEGHLKQMYHCRQCRADAIGTLDNDVSIDYRSSCGGGCGKTEPATKKRYAVASKSGMLVDQHFGHATEFFIYEFDGKTARFVETRSVSKYCAGAEECGDSEDKIGAIINTIKDCNGILALRIGDAPTQKLKALGIEIYTTYDRIEDAVKTAAQSA